MKAGTQIMRIVMVKSLSYRTLFCHMITGESRSSCTLLRVRLISPGTSEFLEFQLDFISWYFAGHSLFFTLYYEIHISFLTCKYILTRRKVYIIKITIKYSCTLLTTIHQWLAVTRILVSTAGINILSGIR